MNIESTPIFVLHHIMCYINKLELTSKQSTEFKKYSKIKKTPVNMHVCRVDATLSSL